MLACIHRLMDHKPVLHGHRKFLGIMISAGVDNHETVFGTIDPRAYDVVRLENQGSPLYRHPSTDERLHDE